MKINDKLEVIVVVAILDNDDNIIDVVYDWRDVDEYLRKHRFGFVIIDSSTGKIPDDMDYADFYLTISDAMSDFNRISRAKNVIAQSQKGRTILELSVMFNLSEKNIEKILSDYAKTV